ncbi:polysaccharide lyase family 7 protein [Frigoriflavimonas asaccharolytica]|uniref:Alginate lyase 2 domain-containing protein n=1 Tax=Frigoriflavimonas asaccharolytica TaxID=2735899 RepID=A0A8J8K8H4_9FLAO|nr:polysaccharide lyase family 7 protein [Frigoriflavimonas asaccharolytica]NRS92626.1 hypothetical protein [Frigoriflavimonas asaccharolytica]
MKFIFKIIFVCILVQNCGRATEEIVSATQVPIATPEIPATGFANINLANWKVTTPLDMDNNGSPDEFSAAQIQNGGYRNIAALQPFMYDDTSDKSIVFYAYPNISTANSDYSRSELREMINPTNSKINWTLNQGGTIEGNLKMVSITPENASSGSSNTYHRAIVMQIHGIISQSDMTTYGFTSNSAPPLLKIFWIDGKIIAYKKTLVNSNTTGIDLYSSSSSIWTDISYDFGTVGYNPFDLKIVASAGKLIVTVNGTNSHTFQDTSLAKWPFENYFKAGNYLITTEPTAKATVKYFKLNVTH